MTMMMHFQQDTQAETERKMENRDALLLIPEEA
jgi:hypothetical protein